MYITLLFGSADHRHSGTPDNSTTPAVKNNLTVDSCCFCGIIIYSTPSCSLFCHVTVLAKRFYQAHISECTKPPYPRTIHTLPCYTYTYKAAHSITVTSSLPLALPRSVGTFCCAIGLRFRASPCGPWRCALLFLGLFLLISCLLRLICPFILIYRGLLAWRS